MQSIRKIHFYHALLSDSLQVDVYTFRFAVVFRILLKSQFVLLSGTKPPPKSNFTKKLSRLKSLFERIQNPGRGITILYTTDFFLHFQPPLLLAFVSVYCLRGINHHCMFLVQSHTLMAHHVFHKFHLKAKFVQVFVGSVSFVFSMLTRACRVLAGFLSVV